MMRWQHYNFGGRAFRVRPVNLDLLQSNNVVAAALAESMGRDPKPWPLYDNYDVTDEVLIPLGEPNRYYIPTAYPRLPYEFAKLEYGNKDSAIQFVEEWGLLGYSKLAGRGIFNI